jgi:hypothetical protein
MRSVARLLPRRAGMIPLRDPGAGANSHVSACCLGVYGSFTERRFAMRRVQCWNDLSAYGFIPLTGEACGLGYRILFDVTDRGKAVLAACFGMPEIRMAEAWNRGGDSDPHVGSVLLSREMLTPVGIFALLQSGCSQVWQLRDGSLIGVDAADSAEHIAAVATARRDDIVRTYACRGTAGDRNVHVMTGRVV